MKVIILVLTLMFSLNSFADDLMSQMKMEATIKKMAEKSKGEKGVVEFVYQGANMYLISDVSNDRMRIISPIAQYSSLTQDQLNKTMISNYHLALDARYALSDGVLYAAYIHPLSKLDEGQIKSAVKQVFNLRATFGAEYTSGILSYGAQETTKEPSAERLYL